LFAKNKKLDKISIDLCITHTLKENDWIEELRLVDFQKFEIYHDYQLQKIEQSICATIFAIK